MVEHLHHAKRLFPSSSPTNVQLNLALRLGGHEAAAFALYWLEEASNSGLHFDQAGLDFMVII